MVNKVLSLQQRSLWLDKEICFSAVLFFYVTSKWLEDMLLRAHVYKWFIRHVEHAEKVECSASDVLGLDQEAPTVLIADQITYQHVPFCQQDLVIAFKYGVTCKVQ